MTIPEPTRQLNRDSDLPLYSQLKNALRGLIEKGTYKPGDLMPSEYQLAEEYRVSRITVKRAVTDLAREGLLYRIQGKGTFVGKPVVNQELRGMFSFSEDIRKAGMECNDVVLEFARKTAPSHVAANLRISDGDLILELARLRKADGVPIAIQHAFLPFERFPSLSREDIVRYGSLYRTLEQKHSCRPASGREIYSVGLVSEEEAKLLQTPPDSPAFRVERFSLDNDGDPIEYVRSVIRGDVYRIGIDLCAARIQIIGASNE